MRFRFCGDLDCPDWVLAEISTLAKISSVKLKLICGQVLKDLQGEGIDAMNCKGQATSRAVGSYVNFTGLSKLPPCREEPCCQAESQRFLLSPESGDVKATIAVLSFILSSAAKHSVDSDSLSSELQQLGLPKEHATGLCRS
ncbi:COMM domain-containing protein 4-like [Gopherus evgoodei]|uniref:COMM domain-containing protein 4-like n=1 Tax=Gopherus evgoodei TaxID=1825980 RepID=UPI0011CF7B45|nr:COMM domain-containing protein 4-like [Gopherus evgoodei]